MARAARLKYNRPMTRNQVTMRNSPFLFLTRLVVIQTFFAYLPFLTARFLSRFWSDVKTILKTVIHNPVHLTGASADPRQQRLAALDLIRGICYLVLPALGGRPRPDRA